MIIYYGDNCAWFNSFYQPNEDERKVLGAVIEALPALPETVRVNNVCEYVQVAKGEVGWGDTQNWVEYHFNVQTPTSKELYSEKCSIREGQHRAYTNPEDRRGHPYR